MGFLGTFVKGVVTGLIGLGAVSYLYTKFSGDTEDQGEADDSNNGEE